MTLPEKKLQKLQASLKQLIRAKHISNKELECLNGKLRHASLAMLWANGLFQPINWALAKNKQFHRLNPTGSLTNAFSDFRAILTLLDGRPTPLTQLIPAKPDIIGKVDISKKGAGSIW